MFACYCFGVLPVTIMSSAQKRFVRPEMPQEIHRKIRAFSVPCLREVLGKFHSFQKRVKNQLLVRMTPKVCKNNNLLFCIAVWVHMLPFCLFKIKHGSCGGPR
jgi:hypothetical protein